MPISGTWTVSLSAPLDFSKEFLYVFRRKVTETEFQKIDSEFRKKVNIKANYRDIIKIALTHDSYHDFYKSNNRPPSFKNASACFELIKYEH